MGPKIEDFDILSTIGSGSHGTVRKVKRRSDGQILVWKELNYRSLSDEEKKGLVLEVNILRELRHPNIVRFLHHIVDRRSTTLYILMEYCPGGDLKTLINKCRKSRTYVEEGFIWRVLKQLTDALKSCHRPHKEIGRVILHRDLKPANVFLDKDGNVKLGDFGLARTLNSESSFATTYVGTPYYMSPEVVDGREYNEQSDIWSLGCMIYELCSLQPPFQAATHEDLHKRIREARYSHIPVQYSAGLQEIISLMITYEDFLRPTALMVLHHPQLLSNTSQFTELSDTQTYPNSTFTSEYYFPIHDNKNVSTHSKNTPTHENKILVSQNSNISINSHNSDTQYSAPPNNVTNTNTISDNSNCTNIAKTDNTPSYASSTPISGTPTKIIVNTHSNNKNKSSTFVYNSESYEGVEYQHQHKQSTDTLSSHIDIHTLNGNALVLSHHANNSEKSTEKYNTEDLHLENEVFLSCRNLKISKDQIEIKSEFHEEFSPYRTHTKSKSFGDTYSHSKSVGSLNNEYCKDLKETIVINNVYDLEFSPFRTHTKSDCFQKQIFEDNGNFVDGINKAARIDKLAFEENDQGLFPFITQKISRAVNEEIVTENDFNWCKNECENNVTKDIVQKHNDSNTFAILTETVERINKEVATDKVEITFGSSELESDLDVSIDFNNCGAKNICICGGLLTDEWQSRLSKVRETEASLRKREIAIEMTERELVKREHKVSQMEREARQHLVRAQIFLRQSRPRSSTATTQPRPASDLDTTVSADVDEMPQTTTKLDPSCIENPFLPLRGVAQVLKHNEKKNVKFKENSMTFKSNTLENPKKLKKPGLVDRGVNCKKTTCDDAAIKYLSTNTNINNTLKKDSSHSDKVSADNLKKTKEKTKIKQKYSNVKSKITFNKFSKKPKESVCDKENICSINLRSKTSKLGAPKSEVISTNVGKEKQRTVAVGSGRVLQFYKAL